MISFSYRKAAKNYAGTHKMKNGLYKNKAIMALSSYFVWKNLDEDEEEGKATGQKGEKYKDRRYMGVGENHDVKWLSQVRIHENDGK